jgi:hypothetical protein
MPDSQQPYPGWLWYQPTTFSGRPAALHVSWKATMYS